MCDRHNAVNEKLGKPLFDCSAAWRLWGRSSAAEAAATLQARSDQDKDEAERKLAYASEEADGADGEDCTFCAD